jgi:hypothetical protein
VWVGHDDTLHFAAGDESSEVESLLERIADALLADDRRDAMANLKDLLLDNPQVHRLGTGHTHIPVANQRSVSL